MLCMLSPEGFSNPSLPDRREDGGGRERKKRPPELVLTHHQVVKMIFIKFSTQARDRFSLGLLMIIKPQIDKSSVTSSRTTWGTSRSLWVLLATLRKRRGTEPTEEGENIWSDPMIDRVYLFDFALPIISTERGNYLQPTKSLWWWFSDQMMNDGLGRWTRVKEAFLAPQNREEEEMSQSLPSSPNRLWQCQEVLSLNLLLHQTVWLCLLLRRPHASRLWPERWSRTALHRIDGADPARHRPRDPEELRGPEAQPVRGVQQEDDQLGPEEVVQGELWRSTSRRWRRRWPTLVRWVPQEVGRVAEDEGLHRRGRPAPKRWSRWDSTTNSQLWSILASRQFWGGSSRPEEEDGPLASEGEVCRENWCPGHFHETVFSWCLVIKHHIK